MNTLREQLLNLYSQEMSVDEIHDSDVYQDLLKMGPKYTDFDRERELIQKSRGMVDSQFQPKDPPDADETERPSEVELALRLLRRIEAQEKEACRELMLRMYGKKWEANQRKYFEKMSLVVMNARDYFLSFTNRNPGKPNFNEVNRAHQYFIIDSIGRDEYERADKSERNLVAETVNYHLKNANFTGFYYPDREGDNTTTEDKLRDNCIGSLAFVQLVQGAMFHNEEPPRNWCLFEYEVVKDDKGKILFVTIEEKIRSDNFPLKVDDWYRAYRKKDSVKLRETRARRREAIEENHREIKEKLANQIQDTVDSIYDGIPN